MSARHFHRVKSCYCRGNPCVCAAWEGRLRKDGLGHLEYEDGMGNVLLGNRGAGKDIAATIATRADAAAGDRAKRLVILQHARFGSAPRPRSQGGGKAASAHRDRKIWELYASGLGYKRIASELGLLRITVKRRVTALWRAHGHLVAPPSLAALVKECEPGALTMFFSLLRRAIDEPAEVAAMLDEAEAMPEMRAILEEGKG